MLVAAVTFRAKAIYLPLSGRPKIAISRDIITAAGGKHKSQPITGWLCTGS